MYGTQENLKWCQLILEERSSVCFPTLTSATSGSFSSERCETPRKLLGISVGWKSVQDRGWMDNVGQSNAMYCKAINKSRKALNRKIDLNVQPLRF